MGLQPSIDLGFSFRQKWRATERNVSKLRYFLITYESSTRLGDIDNFVEICMSEQRLRNSPPLSKEFSSS